MEEICLKTPHIMERIDEFLDFPSLVNCRQVSKIIFKTIEEQQSGRYFWVRMIQNYNMNWTGFEEDWKHVMEKMPVKALKVFALAVQNWWKFWEYDWRAAWARRINHEFNWSPMHIAADYGDLELCKHIARITDLVNPVNRHGFTPKDMIRFAFKSISCSPLLGDQLKFDGGLGFGKQHKWMTENSNILKRKVIKSVKVF